MIAMNPQTWDKDLASIEPGGYLFYDSTKPLQKSKFRDDVHVIGMPLMEICNAAYRDPRQRQLFKNIIYVGALATLLDIDLAEVERTVSTFRFSASEARTLAGWEARTGRRAALTGSYQPRARHSGSDASRSDSICAALLRPMPSTWEPSSQTSAMFQTTVPWCSFIIRNAFGVARF